MSFSPLCLPLSPIPNPPSAAISLSLCCKSSCFKGGNYLIHTQDTQYQQTISRALQRSFSLRTSAPFHTEKSSAAWHRSPTAAERRNEERRGERSYTKEGHAEEKVMLNKLHFSLHQFCPFFSSSSAPLSSILASLPRVLLSCPLLSSYLFLVLLLFSTCRP